MTDEEIEKTLRRNSDNIGGGFDSKVLDYINRLKAENYDMYCKNKNLQSYIDNHEEIWKQNAEIDKAIVSKETAKEIIELMKEVQAMFYDKEYVAIQNIIAKKYGVDIDE